MELMKAGDIIGRKVMDAKQGKDLGSVQDVIYDPSSGKVFAFLVDEQGWFSGASVIYTEDIDPIGEDRILLKSALAMHDAVDEQKKLSGISDTAKGLQKTPVISEKGNQLGVVENFAFDVKTGLIESFDIMQQETGKLQKEISLNKSAVLNFGEDAMIVKFSAEEEM